MPRRYVRLCVRGDQQQEGAIAIPAIGIHHTATTDEAWDGPAAVAAMPNDKATLHYCHAWEAADADDKKSDFKFPHAKTKGGPANLAACRNGLARLEGSNIPEADKAGVKAHLQAHLDDADKKGGDGDGKSDNTAGFPLVHESAWARAGQLGNLVGDDRVRERAVRAHTTADNNECWRITNNNDDVATLDLYGDIGFWGGVTAADFSQQLKNVSAPTLIVNINSGGGDVFDGVAILNTIRAHPATKHVVVQGLAASAASFIAMGGSTVTMMPNSMMMIHDAAGGCLGNAAEMKQMADLLDKVSDNIASIYAMKAGKGTTAEWRDVMRREQWYTADEAVEAGLADRVGDTESPSDVKVATDRWTFNFYNFAGRAAAPAPTPIAAVATAVAPVEPAPVPPIVAVAPVLPVVEPAAPTPVAMADPPPVAVIDPAPAPIPVPAPAAAPALEPALVDRREDETPVWNPDIFRQAMKERAAQ